MFAKIVKGKDLAQLESEVNKFLTDNFFGAGMEPTLKDQLKEAFPGIISNEAFDKALTAMKRLKIYNVQQFVIGEVDPGNVSLMNRAPVPTYSFCLLLICGYE